MPSPAPLVEMEAVWKSFGGRPALAGASLSLSPGEIVGLVGPNGAGKSTLIRILDGVYRPDRGTIRVNGGGSVASTVGVVHQELGIMDHLTLTENVRLGVRSRRFARLFLRRADERRHAAEALASVGLDVSPDALAGSLTPGEQSLLAVARLTARKRRVVVLDETTAALSEASARWLLEHVRGLARAGASVLFVSHRLGEVVDGCDRVVVMVDGRIEADRPVEGLDQDGIARLMTRDQAAGRAVAGRDAGERWATRRPVLELEGVCGDSFGPVDLELSRGEVVGLTGAVGSGLYGLARVAAGVSRPTGGTRRLADGEVVAFVPPDRRAEGLFMDLPVGWNATIGALRRFRRGAVFQSLGGERREAARVCTDLGVVSTGLDQPMRELSGGNQQKVLVARGILNGASVLVLCEPTRGVDVRTRAEIYALIDRLKQAGAAILLVSSHLEEILAVGDRVGVMREGVLTMVDAGPLSDEELAASLVV